MKKQRFTFRLFSAITQVLVIGILFLFNFNRVMAQTDSYGLNNGSGHSCSFNNDAEHPCVSSQDYLFIEKECRDNIKKFNIKQNPLNRNLTTILAWPLKAKDGFTDCSYYLISKYVDLDTKSGLFSDWNCGNQTYDGHNGTDISLYPTPFNKVDNNSVEVIAAAPGIIIAKNDGEFDRNCGTPGTVPIANYIVIEHADGSTTLYWHMKKYSLTPKSIGQTVEQGEYLGIAASSGYSSGPHLHFEVWAGSTVSTRIDPFFGPCNSTISSSWWSDQKAYKEPAILKTSVHAAEFFPAACPNSDTTYESDFYVLPFSGVGLPPNFAKFYISFRDINAGTMINMSILNPDGSSYLNWVFTAANNFKGGIWNWTKKLPAQEGTYTFQASLNGDTCSQNFTLAVATANNEIDALKSTELFPNPSTGQFTISCPVENSEILITNLLGQQILSFQSKKEQTQVELHDDGVYLITIKTKTGNTVRKLIIKKQ